MTPDTGTFSLKLEQRWEGKRVVPENFSYFDPLPFTEGSCVLSEGVSLSGYGVG